MISRHASPKPRTLQKHVHQPLADTKTKTPRGMHTGLAYSIQHMARRKASGGDNGAGEGAEPSAGRKLWRTQSQGGWTKGWGHSKQPGSNGAPGPSTAGPAAAVEQMANGQANNPKPPMMVPFLSACFTELRAKGKRVSSAVARVHMSLARGYGNSISVQVECCTCSLR